MRTRTSATAKAAATLPASVPIALASALARSTWAIARRMAASRVAVNWSRSPRGRPRPPPGGGDGASRLAVGAAVVACGPPGGGVVPPLAGASSRRLAAPAAKPASPCSRAASAPARCSRPAAARAARPASDPRARRRPPVGTGALGRVARVIRAGFGRWRGRGRVVQGGCSGCADAVGIESMIQRGRAPPDPSRHRGRFATLPRWPARRPRPSARSAPPSCSASARS